ncbi:MAG: hypothetical protein ACRD8O_08130 [Bryobacteraceae bacterium]
MSRHRIAFTVLFVLGLAALSMSQDRRSADFETLEGTWILDLNAPPVATQILTTFARGGTIVAEGNATQPILRSSWYGVWARRAYLDFTSTWQRWNFDAAGNFASRSELRMDIHVDGRLETFSGTVEVLSLDRAGNVTATRPGTFRATRLNPKGPN